MPNILLSSMLVMATTIFMLVVLRVKEILHVHGGFFFNVKCKMKNVKLGMAVTIMLVYFYILHF